MITEKELKLIRHQKGGGKNYHRKKRMLDKKHKEREDKIYEFGQLKKRALRNAARDASLAQAFIIPLPSGRWFRGSFTH